MNLTEIEHAGFCSWPAEEQRDKDGMILRFSSGYTKRANSATALTQQAGNYSNLMQLCESYYREKRLPCIFRLPSFSQNKALDNYLQLNAYKLIDRSVVLYKSLENSSPNTVHLHSKKPVQWVKSFCNLNSTDIHKQQPHIEILNRITDEMILAVLIEEGVEVACGVAVISNQYCGIFDVVTGKNYRNRGYATKLLNALLNWAQSKGVTKSYIQVVENNQPAIHLYEKLGYQTAYTYHYRIKQNP